MTTRHLQRAFTLLEVMIAVTVFAAIATVISSTISQTTDTLLTLENRTLASWVAENRLADVRIGIITSGQLPNTRPSHETVEMASREWEVETRVETTPFPDTLRITVSVSHPDDPEYQLAELSTVLGVR